MLTGGRSRFQGRVRVPSRDILRGKKQGMVSSDHLGRFIPFDQAGAWIPARDRSFRAQHQNRTIPDAIHQQAEPLLPLPNSLKLHTLPHPIEFDEHGHFTLQHCGDDWFEQVIDRPAGQPPEHVLLQLVDSREKDNRRMARLLALPDQLGGFESIDPRHTDVEQDHGKIMP